MGISGFKSPLKRLISIVSLIITPFITTHVVAFQLWICCYQNICGRYKACSLANWTQLVLRGSCGCAVLQLEVSKMGTGLGVTVGDSGLGFRT